MTQAEMEKLEGEKARKACKHKHTKYQPTEAEWKCPNCDAPIGDFCVDECVNAECPDLHPDDGLICYGLNGKGCPGEYGTSGQAFANLCVKKNNLVKCNCCNGTGYVKAETGTKKKAPKS